MAKTKKKPAAKKKNGRPPEKVSDKVDHEQLALLCQKGFTDIDLAHFYKKAKSTINRWKADEKFKQILHDNKAIANDQVKNALFNRAIGTTLLGADGTPSKVLPADVEAIKFWLMNRDGDEWRIKQDHTVTKPIKVELDYRKEKDKNKVNGTPKARDARA